jgi:hypothetical protein
MLALTRTAIVAAALAAGAVVSLGSANLGTSQATAAENSPLYCQGYAQDAQRSYRAYQRKQCGNLVNTVWNSDYGMHYGYCLRNSQVTTEWLKNLRYRVILNNCQN